MHYGRCVAYIYCKFNVKISVHNNVIGLIWQYSRPTRILFVTMVEREIVHTRVCVCCVCTISPFNQCPKKKKPSRPTLLPNKSNGIIMHADFDIAFTKTFYK